MRFGRGRLSSHIGQQRTNPRKVKIPLLNHLDPFQGQSIGVDRGNDAASHGSYGIRISSLSRTQISYLGMLVKRYLPAPKPPAISRRIRGASLFRQWR